MTPTPSGTPTPEDTLKAYLDELHTHVYRTWESDPKRHPIGMSIPPYGRANEILSLFATLRADRDRLREALQKIVDASCVAHHASHFKEIAREALQSSTGAA